MKRDITRWVCIVAGCLFALSEPDPDREREVAVLDRIVDGEHAVLLVGDPPERELVAPAEALPAGARGGHWLEIELEDGDLVGAEIDHEATERAAERVREKLERLREEGAGDP